jgi:Mrp family chromosome partitioning ATPase
VPTLRRVLDNLHKSGRVIVVAGPTTSSPEGAAVVAVCDVALLCVTPQESTFNDVEVAIDSVSTSRTELLGAVLTHRVPRAQNGSPARSSSGGFLGGVFGSKTGTDSDRQEP